MDSSHPDWHVMVPHCGFDLHFSDNEWWKNNISISSSSLLQNLMNHQRSKILQTFWWHHWFNGHEFEQAPGVGDGQGTLVCCGWWGHKESDMTEQLNWTELPSHRFTDASGRCCILGSETEDFIFTAQPTPWVSAFCDWRICIQQAVSHERVPEVREPRSFIKGNRHFYWKT